MTNVDTISAEKASSHSTSGSKNSIERVTLRLPIPLYERLEELQNITHATSINEVLKNALIIYSTLVREQTEGNFVFVISPEGEKTKYPVFV